jgi:hypothetical protein
LLKTAKLQLSQLHRLPQVLLPEAVAVVRLTIHVKSVPAWLQSFAEKCQVSAQSVVAATSVALLHW